MTRSTYPHYIEDGPDLTTPHGPYMLENARIAAWLLKADRSQLETLCNIYLNISDDKQVIYRPVSPYVMLVCADMTIYSLAERHRQAGRSGEIDVAFWILTLALKRVGNFYVPDHLAWFLPYVFVNNPSAVATGREVYGFRKDAAQISSIKHIRSPEFTVDAFALETLGSESTVEYRRLLSVKRKNASPKAEAPFWTGAQQAQQAILGALAGNEAGKVMVGWLEKSLDLLDVSRAGIPFVFLKQFRHVADTRKACYQAIVEAPARTTAFHGGGLLDGEYQIELQSLQSHPIAEKLGLQLQNGKIDATAGWWVNIDFVMDKGREVWRAHSPVPEKPKPQARFPGRKQKIAILGGGVGSLSAAFALTNREGWQDEYEITVYQMGWRLGGKGASGRDAGNGQRIEEHGLHVWFGCYDHAFRMIRQCYQELHRPPGTPLATWDQAFTPHNFIVYGDFHEGTWKNWEFDFPSNAEIPGEGKAYSSQWEYIQRIVTWMQVQFQSLPQQWFQTILREATTNKQNPTLAHQAFEHMLPMLESAGLGLAGKIISSAQQLVDSLDDDVRNHNPLQHKRLSWLLWSLVWQFKSMRILLHTLATKEIKRDDWLRRQEILLEIAAVVVSGMIDDRILHDGFDVVDHLDFREWLMKNGASEAVAYSTPVRAFYDAFFAYPKGDVGNSEPCKAGDLAAGSALRCLLASLLDYKGAFLWKMQAGMGDVVIAPLYEVLKRRGVEFRFFHKITDLEPGPDRTIERITLNRQVDLKAEIKEYQPLVHVKGLPCWPNQPIYDQIEQGEELQGRGIDLESSWTAWQDVEKGIVLEKGRDFDHVILGIPVGALKAICPKIIAMDSRWRDMTEHLKTVQTLALQLWFEPSLQELGWVLPPPICNGYAQPFSTWTGMDQTLAHENYSIAQEPRHVAYFCGAMRETDTIPPPTDYDFPSRENERVKSQAFCWLKENVHYFWPNMSSARNLGWEMLYCSRGRTGAERLNSQFWRANINPSDRYVLSVKGSTKYRIRPDESGFSNLFLVGDWTNNGLNVGAVEPTVLSGMQAAEVLSGHSAGIRLAPEKPHPP